MRWKHGRRRNAGASVEEPAERWPHNWDEPEGLSPEDRVRAVVVAITDGSTARPDQLQGLTDDAVHQVELDQSAPMAAAYRAFLTLIGGGAGRFLRGSDAYYPDVVGLGAAARELLEENDSPFEFEETDRVFFMHQGYQFDFMRGPGPDPEVWSYSEGHNDDLPLLNFAHFTDWLRAQAESEIPVWARHTALQGERPRNLTFFRMNPDGSRTEEW